MNKIKIITLVLAIAVPVVVFFQNLHEVPLHLLFAHLSMPASLMYFSHLLLGFLAGWIAHSLRRRRSAAKAEAPPAA